MRAKAAYVAFASVARFCARLANGKKCRLSLINERELNMKLTLKTLVCFGFAVSLSACQMPSQEDQHTSAEEAVAAANAAALEAVEGAVCMNCN